MLAPQKTREERNVAVAQAAKDDSFCWVAACGGNEKPFVKNGKTYLYMWNYKSRVHAYYCCMYVLGL